VTPRLAPAVALLLAALPGIVPGAAGAAPVTRNFVFLAQKNDYPPSTTPVNYSACWSYIHSNGAEYAVLGVCGGPPIGGTAIYNVTNPAVPYLVGFIQGPSSIWREFKSYRDWIYVVTEGGGPDQGVQIIRMTNPESPVLAATYTTGFVTSHTVSVDTTRGILICNGTRDGNGLATGMRILALNDVGLGATPENPVEIAWWPGGLIPVSSTNYVHDSVPVGNRLYAASINAGIERVLDFANPAAPSEMVEWTYPGAFSHNSWPDASGNWLYITDEIKGEPLKIFDISNMLSPVLANTITSNPQAIIHNAHVRGNELYLSNYTEGIRALDLSDPAHPAEFASADSYFGPSGGYSGVWEVCPNFPSGTVIASDRNSGLYVYGVSHDYGIIRARVVNAADNMPLAGADVHLTTQGDSLVTPADGIVQFAPSPGPHTMQASLFGWTTASATRTVTAGSRDTVTLALSALPVVNFAGTVRSAVNGAPLDGSEVSLAYTPIHEHTGPDGAFAIDVPEGTYRLQVRRAGFVPIDVDRHIGPGFPGQDFSLTPAAFYDDLEATSGWTIAAAGDNANTGIWTLASPLGSGQRPPGEAPQEISAGVTGAGAAPGGASSAGAVAAVPGAGRPRRSPMTSPLDAQHEEPAPGNPNMAPYMDHTPGLGVSCFVTGQGSDSTNIDQADVDNGRTSLTTPTLNASGMNDPVIGYWRWFASYFPQGTTSGSNGPEPNDWLAVLISNDNGANWTVVDTTRGFENHWEEQAIHVAQRVVPTAQVRLRFVANDGSPASIVEAAIDDVTLYDAAIPPIAVPPSGGGRLAFRAPWPNPASGPVRLVLDLPAPGLVSVEVLDLQGRRVRTLQRGPAGPGPLMLAWDGRDDAGREASAGLYFARAAVGSSTAFARIARVR
jgi:choice-of-anchor B domain-containing protein